MSGFKLLAEKINTESKGIRHLRNHCRLKFGDSGSLSAKDRAKIQRVIALLEKTEAEIMQAVKKTGMSCEPMYFQEKIREYLEEIWATQKFLSARCDESLSVQ